MKIIVNSEEVKEELKSYLKFLNNFSIKKISINGKDTLFANNEKNVLKDISKRKTFKLKKFDFNYKIFVDEEISYCEMKTKDEKEFKKVKKYVTYLRYFYIKSNLSKKSSMNFNGETLIGKKGFYTPVEDKFSRAYTALLLCDIT